MKNKQDKLSDLFDSVYTFDKLENQITVSKQESGGGAITAAFLLSNDGKKCSCPGFL